MKYKIIIALILILAFIIRAYPIATSEYPIGYDVFYHMQSAEAILKGISYDEYGCLGRPFAYPPVYHWLIAGMGVFGGIEFIVSWISPVLGFLSIYVVYLLCRKIFNERIGIIAGFLLAINKVFIDATVSAGMPQVLDFVLIPLVLLLLMKYREIGGSKKRAMLVPIFIILAVLGLSHPFGYFIAAAIVVGYSIINKDKILFAVTLVTCLPLLLWYATLELTPVLPLWGIHITIEKLGLDFGFIILIGILGFVFEMKKNKLLGIWLIITAVGCFHFIFGVDILSIRFLPYLAQPLCIFAALLIDKLYNNKQYVMIAVSIILILITCVYPAVVYVMQLKPIITAKDFEAIKWIKNNTPEDAVFAATPIPSGMFFSYYAERKTLTCAYREVSFDPYKIGEAAKIIFESSDMNKTLEILGKYNISYIYFTDLEKQYPPENVKYAYEKFDNFEMVYNNSYAYVYRVV